MLFAELLGNEAASVDPGVGDLLLRIAVAVTVPVILGYHAVGLWHMVTRRSKKAEDDAVQKMEKAVEKMAAQVSTIKEEQAEFIVRDELERAVKTFRAENQKLEAYVYNLAKVLADGQQSLALTVAKQPGEMGDRFRQELREEMAPVKRSIDELVRTTSGLLAQSQHRTRNTSQGRPGNAEDVNQ